jgi:hypothetical protein
VSDGLLLVPVEEADFGIRDDGATFHLRPASEAGCAWVAAHHNDDELTLEGGVAVEPRELDAIIDQIEHDGLRLGPHEGSPRIDTWPGECDF